MINKYPYTDFHEINLDWIIAQIKALHHAYDDFKALNTITNAGAWDITKQYQAWTVVSDNNAGYISLKPVPAGIAITNTEYWGFIADYNILITNLTARIAALEADMAVVKPRSLSNKNRIDKLERRALYIGNSYTKGVGSSTGTTGIYALTKDLFTESYDYIDGGVGFLTYTGHSTSFLTLLANAIADPLFDNDTITDVIFIGAWGESNALIELGTSQFINDELSAVSTAVYNVQANFPNCSRISYAWAETRGIHTITTAVGANPYSTPFAVHRLMNIICPRVGMQYLGWIGFASFMNDNNMSADHYHPNDSGYREISAKFKEAYTGTLSYVSKFDSSTFHDSAIASTLKISYRLNVLPDRSELIITNMKMDSGDSTIARYSTDNLLDFSNDSLMPPVPFGDFDIGLFVFYLGRDSDGIATLPVRLRLRAITTADGLGTAISGTSYNKETCPASSNLIYDGGYVEIPVQY